MPTLLLPYDQGRTLALTVPDRNYLGCADLPRLAAVSDPAAEIRRALADPVASPPLADLARGKKRVAIAVTDITRYCPDDLLVNALLGELARAGVLPSALTFVLALGSHRPMTRGEIAAKLGSRISDAYRVLNHDWKDDRGLADLGTEDGFPIQVSREVAEADLRLATGVIEPHLFAGYSGGAKTMVIGAGGHATIAATHGYEVLSHSSSRLGNADSVFRRFINRAGERVGGIVIVPAPCPDGVGEETSCAWMRDTPDGASIVEKARREGIPEGTHMAYRFGRFLTHASQVIVTEQQALDHALAVLGSDAKVLVIPHGVATIPVLAA